MLKEKHVAEYILGLVFVLAFSYGRISILGVVILLVASHLACELGRKIGGKAVIVSGTIMVFCYEFNWYYGVILAFVTAVIAFERIISLVIVKAKRKKNGNDKLGITNKNSILRQQAEGERKLDERVNDPKYAFYFDNIFNRERYY